MMGLILRWGSVIGVLCTVNGLYNHVALLLWSKIWGQVKSKKIQRKYFITKRSKLYSFQFNYRVSQKMYLSLVERKIKTI